jgi:hypothetical protein
MAYYRKWQQLDGSNHKDINDFHPVTPGKWTELEYIEGKDINMLLEKLRKRPPFILDAGKLRRDNSIWRSRIRSVLSKIGLK